MWPFKRRRVFKLGCGETLVAKGDLNRIPAVALSDAPHRGIVETDYFDVVETRRRIMKQGVILQVHGAEGARVLIRALEDCIKRIEAKETADRLLDEMDKGVEG